MKVLIRSKTTAQRLDNLAKIFCPLDTCPDLKPCFRAVLQVIFERATRQMIRSKSAALNIHSLSLYTIHNF